MTLTTKTFTNARDHQPAELDREDRATLIAVLGDWFELWTQASFIDGEYIAEAGELVGASRHADIDVAVAEFLRRKPTAAMFNVAGAFLDGYWLRRAVSDSFDMDGYSVALDVLPPTDRAYAATALALYSALVSGASRLSTAQRAAIRQRLLVARGKLLSHNLFPHVLVSLNYLVGPGQSQPIVDTGAYRGYRCDDGPSTYFVVERAADHTEVIHVHDVILRDRRLEVPFEMQDSRHADADAPPLIGACILTMLLDDRFRGQADSVDYVNVKTEATQTQPYPIEMTS